jgi:TetR/AcrR family transcriptional repressor of lmrAB and yxaGH operons
MASTQDQQLPLRERNRLRTRGDILDAAAEILSESGYAGTTVEELSQRAGLARGTLYAHFPGGREEIVREAYLRIADAVYVRGISLREQAVEVPDRIAALARALLEAAATPAGRFYGVMGSDMVAVLTGAGVPVGTSKSFEDLIRRDLEEARAAARLRQDAPTAALATAFCGAIGAAGTKVAADPGSAEEQIAAIRLLAQGLLGPAAGQAGPPPSSEGQP